MTPDEELMVIFGALHVVALVLGVVLFMMFLRSDTTSSWKPPEDDEGGGGGGNDRLPSTPKPRPTGGIPLPDAEPAEHAAARTTPSSATRARARSAGRSTRPRRAARRPATADAVSSSPSSADRLREREQLHAAAGQRPLAAHAHALHDRQPLPGAPGDAGGAGRRVSESRVLGS